MTRYIALLEDDPRRIGKMKGRCLDRFPHQFVCFEDSRHMIDWLLNHSEEVDLLSLDHDLISASTGVDLGTGREVVDWICSYNSVASRFPIVIHSSNHLASDGMEIALIGKGWDVSRVLPYGDLDWIDEGWFPLVRSLLLQLPNNSKSLTTKLTSSTD